MGSGGSGGSGGRGSGGGGGSWSSLGLILGFNLGLSLGLNLGLSRRCTGIIGSVRVILIGVVITPGDIILSGGSY